MRRVGLTLWIWGSSACRLDIVEGDTDLTFWRVVWYPRVRVPTNAIGEIMDCHRMVTICRIGNWVDLFRGIVELSPKEGLGIIG